VAGTSDNLLPVMREALMAGSTIGEVSDVLRGVFGVHRPS
jgi:methylmalonyl-CoA mutase N-terminal domain/subunit